MGVPWFRWSEGKTTAAIEASERFALMEAQLQALIDGGGGFIGQATQLLSSAQVRTLPETPITMVSFPSANRFIWPIRALLWHEWADDFATIDSAASIFFDNGKALLGILTETNTDITNLLAGGATKATIVNSRSEVVSGYTVGTPNLNADMVESSLLLMATNGSAGNFTGGGDGTLRVTVVFHVFDLSTGLLVAA